MLWWVLALGCSSQPADLLGAEGRIARVGLEEALVQRDPKTVAKAARTASKWEGKDPVLDRLLGDSLANVLMKPDDGLALLRANPDPADPSWGRAFMSAAMRSGTAENLAEAWAAAGRPAAEFAHPVVHQVAQRARLDPAMGPELLEDVVGRCVLLDGQPMVGRDALDLPAMPELIAAAGALGAAPVAVGRASRRTDPDPVTGAGPWRCQRRTLMDTQWPEPIPRSFVIGATDGQSRVFIDVQLQNDLPWAYAASDSAMAARWIRAASLYKDAGGGAQGVAKVRQVLGTGLRTK